MVIGASAIFSLSQEVFRDFMAETPRKIGQIPSR